jgi:hypothetical protein
VGAREAATSGVGAAPPAGGDRGGGSRHSGKRQMKCKKQYNVEKKRKINNRSTGIDKMKKALAKHCTKVLK